jgi:hypothetical protein
MTSHTERDDFARRKPQSLKPINLEDLPPPKYQHLWELPRQVERLRKKGRWSTTMRP